MNCENRRIRIQLAAFVLLFAIGGARAQATQDAGRVPEAPAPATTSIEALNYLGGDTSMPPFSDSAIDVNSGYRQAMLRQGLAVRLIAQGQYAQNMLNAPVAAESQEYVGQRAFTGVMLQPILTADLRQLHLRNAQLYVGGVWNRVSWDPAGPNAFQLWDLYLYKAFGEDRVETKAGYVSMNLDFVGLFVGGSTAAGGQGVYAVLPYEAGMSYFPLTSPGATMRVRGPNHTYFKAGAQRSIDPQGGPTEVARNHAGFRFIPRGDKLLLIHEGGYLREATRHAHEAWLRGGYMYNTTAYSNVTTGKSEAGNYCGYVLMDYQLRRSSYERPNEGWYGGGSWMTAPESLNPYARYYEARLYKEAPFQRRPADLFSVVASRTGYSSQYTDKLVADGKTVWRAGTTLTGSYSMRVARGNYLNLGLSYVNGPAITPRVPSALKFQASWTTFF
ncbi:MAG TPA: carbohydrate porin [Terracidiphilus sp.]|nr:carbohydrate porin [Terracidiphilus sp.]